MPLSQGPNVSGGVTDDGESVSGSTAWTGPADAQVADSDYAFAVMGTTMPTVQSNWLLFKDLGFSIPASAIIKGIEVAIVGHETNASGFPGVCVVLEVYLIKADATQSTHKYGPVVGGNFYMPHTTDAALYFTEDMDQTDLWGLDWTPAEINDPDFGFRLYCSGGGSFVTTAFIDYAQVTVHYTMPSNGNQVIWT